MKIKIDGSRSVSEQKGTVCAIVRFVLVSVREREKESNTRLCFQFIEKETELPLFVLSLSSQGRFKKETNKHSY
jgi:hypothetical protein